MLKYIFNICDNGSMNTCGVNVMEKLIIDMLLLF